MLRAVVLTGALLACLGGPSAHADPMLADFDYPYPVKRYEFTSQRQPLSMAYMDVAPTGEANGKAVVLLHGKNFCGATWEGQIAPLAAAGYRVVVPDQVGFCKSSKPAAYQMSLHQLAANTRALLKSIGVEKPIIVGHSMGGMLAMRYALSFPTDLSALMLVNPLGLEDWSAKGVPARSVDELFEGEKKTDAAKIKAYQLKTYYDGQWKPEYDRWVEMLASMYAGEGGNSVAWSQALASDMIFSQPVVHELSRITVPTVLFIGEKDNTAIGKDRAPPDVAKGLGNTPKLAPAAAEAIPGAKLVTFLELGHSPQVQDRMRFNAALIEALGRVP
jgi:pimeloyl-ACP methyl ester carboxylesterase